MGGLARALENAGYLIGSTAKKVHPVQVPLQGYKDTSDLV